MTMPAARAYFIRIFLPGGDPEGLKLVEKSNWNGCGLVFPRTLYSEARKRQEIERPGVYVLVGPPEVSGLPRVYIGEGDPIRPRMEQHLAKKEFWVSAVVFTSKDNILNKAHVQYLEARLVRLAGEAKRCALDNGNAPQPPTMSEPDTADAEGFLAEMLLCFPVLGLSIFDTATPSGSSAVVFHLSGKGIKATGQESSQGFVVHAGSQAKAVEVASLLPYLSVMRSALRDNGVLKPEGPALVFTQDYTFTSPSAAASVVLGCGVSGLTVWRTTGGITLRAVRQAEVAGE